MFYCFVLNHKSLQTLTNKQNINKQHKHNNYNRPYSSETSQAQTSTEPSTDPDDPEPFDHSLQQRLRVHHTNTTTTLLLWQPIQQQQQPLLLLLHTILRKPLPAKTPRLSTPTVGTDCRFLLGVIPVLLATGPKTNQCLLLLKKKEKKIDWRSWKWRKKQAPRWFDNWRGVWVYVLFFDIFVFNSVGRVIASNVLNNLLWSINLWLVHVKRTKK